ncbi:hypothetical protein FRC02_008459 [Tulasnella sp. 418]|nr:hypothetical protein FRC02_008459 [Tulasnella sp. 418]
MSLKHASSLNVSSDRSLPAGGISKLHSFPTSHHLHHALAKSLHRGEPTQLAPAEVPVFFAPIPESANPPNVWMVEAAYDVKSELLWLLTEPFETWSLSTKDQWRLQLVTSSKDQGWMRMGNPLQFDQSWFEYGIRSPSAGTSTWEKDRFGDPFKAGGDLGQPKLHPQTRVELRWHSHNNFLFGHDFMETEGKLIGADHELWQHLGPNDRIAVYMCTRARGRKNYCKGGSLNRFKTQSRPGLPVELVRKILRMANITSPQPRTLDAEYVMEPQKQGIYGIESRSSIETRELWIVSKAISRQLAHKIAQIQVMTVSKDQGWGDSGGGSYSWFSLGILRRLPGGVYGPRTQPGSGSYIASWKSHNNKTADPEFTSYEGNKYGAHEEPLTLLTPGDRLCVWMHAQYTAWANYAQEGKIVYWEFFEPTLL